MPRRFLVRAKHNTDRRKLIDALVRDVEGPSAKMLIAEMEDQKPEIFAREIMRQSSELLCMKASQPVMMSQCMGAEGTVLPPAIDVSLEQNEFFEDTITPEMRKRLKNAADQNQNLPFIDFTKPEDLFDFSIKTKHHLDHNQHPVLRLAKSLKSGFLKQIMDYYQIPPKTSQTAADVLTDRTALSGVGPSGSGSSTLIGVGIDDQTTSNYACHECKKQFTALHLFQQHFLSHPDPENKRFLCQVCGKRFSRADHLNRHAQLHTNIKVHKCILCGEEFARASHLDKHRRRTHAAGLPAAISKPYTADNNLHLLASVASPESSGFQIDHTTANNTGHLQSVEIEQAPVIVLSNLLAAKSAQGFRSMDIDVEEMEFQAEPERPFPCNVCGRKFIRATHLRRHMRIHTGEKPFFCHICGRRYARGDYLRAHIHAHRREKVHKCRACGEVFHDLARYSNHCLSHNESEFNEASLRENKKRAENKLTQQLSSGKRIEVAHTAEPAAVMPSQTDYQSLIAPGEGEMCIAPIEVENPIHMVAANHEYTISTTMNCLPCQADPEYQEQGIIMGEDLASGSSSRDVHIMEAVGGAQQFSVPSSSSSMTNPQSVVSHIMSLPTTPQDVPAQSPNLSHIVPLTYLLQSSASSPRSSPPPLTQPTTGSEVEIFQHYNNLGRSLSNDVMLITPTINMTSSSEYGGSSSNPASNSAKYFPTPTGIPYLGQFKYSSNSFK